MKHVIYLILILTLFTSTFGYAQEATKIGHINYSELAAKVPEIDSIQNILNMEAAEMEKIYTELIEEYERNVEKYENEKATYSEFVKNTKEKELVDATQKIQEFRQSAGEKLEKRNLELMQPVYTKVNRAIEKIAVKNNYTYIFDINSGNIVYSDNQYDLGSVIAEELVPSRN